MTAERATKYAHCTDTHWQKVDRRGLPASAERGRASLTARSTTQTSTTTDEAEDDEAEDDEAEDDEAEDDEAEDDKARLDAGACLDAGPAESGDDPQRRGRRPDGIAAKMGISRSLVTQMILAAKNRGQ